MATIAKLDVLLGLEDGAFQRGLESSREKLDKWGSNLRGMGTKLTAGVTAPIVGSGLAVVKWASDLEQTVGATEQLWGDNSETIFAWAKKADQAMGMTENSALQNANRFNAMFKQTDEGTESILKMSQGFTELSADLSAMWGGSPDEAANRLTSALRGNYEGLDQYNINLTEAMVNQEAMNIAMADGRDEITEADKVMARYNLIMEQSGDAQGQFARESDTTAGKLAIATARAKNAATAFGKLLLPYVNKLLDAFSKMVEWIENLSDTQRKWILGIAAAAAALGPLLLVIGMLLPGISALIAVVGFLLSPVGLIVVAIAALVAGLTYAYFEFETFRNIVDTTASVIKDVAIAAFQAFLRAMQPVADYIKTLIGIFMDLKNAFTSALSGDWGGAWESIKSAFSGGVDAFLQWLVLVPSMILNALGIDLTTLWQKGSDLLQGLWDGAVQKWNAVSLWVGLLGSAAVNAAGDFLATLWQKGVDLIIGLGEGAVAQWANLSTWISNRGAMAVTAIGALLTTLWQKGVDLFIGLGDGATAQWKNLATWLSNRGTAAVDAVGSLFKTLFSRGQELLNGMRSGILDIWESKLYHWLTGIGSKIVSAVGSLAGTLYGAGEAVMNSLWDGMKAVWGNISGWLSDRASIIKNLKGPIQEDRKLLIPEGQAIMQSLGIGLDNAWRDVQRQVAGYGPRLSGTLSAGLPAYNTPSFAGAHAQPQVVVTQHVTLMTPEPERFAQFLHDAKRGAEVADYQSNPDSISQWSDF